MIGGLLSLNKEREGLQRERQLFGVMTDVVFHITLNSFLHPNKHGAQGNFWYYGLAP